MKNEKKTLGIIGGMGPAATAALFQKIIDKTKADRDADHIHILIDNYPQIPDRTAAILNGSDEPLEYICRSGQKLVDIGADILLIPCNTSHYYYDKIKERLSVPVLNMIEETAIYCKNMNYKTVGVLATDGTKSTGIYETELKKNGLDVVYPSEVGQKEVMSVIYDYVKAGRKVDKEKLYPHLCHMKEQGVQAFILGCTELPIAIKDGDFGYKFIDTIEILADSAIIKSGYSLKIFKIIK